MKVSFLAVQMIPLLVLVPCTSTHWDQLGETLPSVSCDAQWQKPNEVLPEIHVLQQAVFRWGSFAQQMVLGSASPEIMQGFYVTQTWIIYWNQNWTISTNDPMGRTIQVVLVHASDTSTTACMVNIFCSRSIILQWCVFPKETCFFKEVCVNGACFSFHSERHP